MNCIYVYSITSSAIIMDIIGPILSQLYTALPSGKRSTSFIRDFGKLAYLNHGNKQFVVSLERIGHHMEETETDLVDKLTNESLQKDIDFVVRDLKIFLNFATFKKLALAMATSLSHQIWRFLHAIELELEHVSDVMRLKAELRAVLNSSCDTTPTRALETSVGLMMVHQQLDFVVSVSKVNTEEVRDDAMILINDGVVDHCQRRRKTRKICLQDTTLPTSKILKERFFLMKDDERFCSITYVEGSYTIISEFREAFCQAMGSTNTPAIYSNFKEDREILKAHGFKLSSKTESTCMICKRFAVGGCCPKQSKANTRGKLIVYGMHLIRKIRDNGGSNV